MVVAVTVQEESVLGQSLGSLSIELVAEEVTVEELIRSYVYQGVKDSEMRRGNSVSPQPVPPSQDEVTLNGGCSARADLIDWQSEFLKAKAAFRKHQILVFVDGQQISSLDAVVNVSPNTDVKFLRLTMLMGG